MKKLLLLPALLLSVLLFMQSCSKESPAGMVAAKPDNVINATLSLNQTYQLPVNNSGDVSISKQASHFDVSKTEIDLKSSLLVYKYVPVAGYVGSDDVILNTRKMITSMNSGGCNSSHNNSETISYATSSIVIRFNITK